MTLRGSHPIGITLLLSLVGSGAAQAQANVEALEELGKRVFFENISVPARQSCSSCHAPDNGWTGNVAAFNLMQVAIPGADPHTMGGRKPPSVAYASFSPDFGNNPLRSNACLASTALSSPLDCKGGVFWDGRAKGTQIGTEVFAGAAAALQAAYMDFLGPVADQALGPFPNDVEQNVDDGDDGGLPGAQAVCHAVESARYAELFSMAWNTPIACDPENVALSFKRIAVAISAWEHSAEVNSFSSKRDMALAADSDHMSPHPGLTDEENLGHDLFFGIQSALNPQKRNARCSACHNSEGAGSTGDEVHQLYTDHVYRNIGLPPNPEIANFDPAMPDEQLFRTTQVVIHRGAAKTPNLRNVDKRRGAGFPKAYMHNGFFKSLQDVVHFYNTASALDVCPINVTTAADARKHNCWPAAEFPAGAARGGAVVGNLGLTNVEEAALVAYLKTLSDTQTIAAPTPYIP